MAQLITYPDKNTGDFFSGSEATEIKNVVNANAVSGSSGSFSGSYEGDGSGLTGITAADVEYANVLNKPTLVSGSAQISYTGITNVPVGIISGSNQLTGSFLEILGDNVVSSSTQVNSGSFSGSFEGDGSGLTGITSVSASYASSGPFWKTAGTSTLTSATTIETGTNFIVFNSDTWNNLTFNDEYFRVTGDTTTALWPWFNINVDTGNKTIQAVLRGTSGPIYGLNINDNQGVSIGWDNNAGAGPGVMDAEFNVSFSGSLTIRDTVNSRGVGYIGNYSGSGISFFGNEWITDAGWTWNNFISSSDTVVSGSSQISYNGITDIPSGIVSSSAQLDSTFLEILNDNVVSSSAQIDLASATGTASWADNAVSASYVPSFETLQSVTDNGNTTTNDIIISATQKLYLDGGGDTYIWEKASNEIAFHVGGTDRFAAISSQFISYITGGFTLYGDPASGNPIYTFRGDTDTGMDRTGNDTLTLVTSGTEAIIIDSSQNVTMSADLNVVGNVYANEFHTQFVSSSIIFSSGSTKFGDTQDDTHDFTGSVNITGSLSIIGTTSGSFVGDGSGLTGIPGTLLNIEDSGTNVQNTASGSGYLAWDNLQINGDEIKNISNAALLTLTARQGEGIYQSIYFNADASSVYPQYSGIINLGSLSNYWDTVFTERVSFKLLAGGVTSSVANGEMWYNNTTNKLETQESGSVINVIEPDLWTGSIGTITRESDVEVTGSITATSFSGSFSGSFTGDGSGLTNVPGAGGGGLWLTGSGGDIYYNGGDVGIGTSNPVAKLHVLGIISGSSDLQINGTVNASIDTDSTHILGRARIDSRTADYMYISHYDLTTTSNHALYQSSTGATKVNFAGGQSIAFTRNGSAQWTVNDSGNLVGASGNDLAVTNANISGSHIGDGSGLTGLVSASYAVSASWVDTAVSASYVPSLQQVTDNGFKTTNIISSSTSIIGDRFGFDGDPNTSIFNTAANDRIHFQAAGTDVFTIRSTRLVPEADNSYDIGIATSNRIQNIYLVSSGGSAQDNILTLNTSTGLIEYRDVATIRTGSFSGSFSGSFEGDGSGLTGITTSDTLQTITDNGNTTTNDLIVTGSVNISGSLTVNKNENITTFLGNTRIFSPSNGYATFAHTDHATTATSALIQRSGGETILNTVLDQELSFRINNVSQWIMDSSGSLSGSVGNDLLVSGKLKIIDADRVEIFMEDSGISTPFTDVVPDGTIAKVGQSYTADGGIAFQGFTNSATTIPVRFQGNVGSNIPTAPAIAFEGWKLLGAGRVPMSGSEIIAEFSPGQEPAVVTFVADGGVTAVSFTGSFSGSYEGDGSGLTGITSDSASYVEYTNIANKPTLVSGSAQISYTGISDVPANIVSSSAQLDGTFLEILNDNVVSGSSQISYTGITDIPANIVSSSAQLDGTFLEILNDNVVSSSAQIDLASATGTASWADNAVSASYAPSNPSTSNLQIITDNGNQTTNDIIITGSLIVSSSRAVFNNGSTSSPGIVFENSLTSGWYSSGTAIIKMTLGGTDRWQYAAGNFIGLAASAPQISNVSSTATVPTFVPNRASSTTGIGGTTGTVSIIIAGSEAVRVDASQNVTMSADLNVVGNVYANEFHTQFVSSSIIFSSGSTKFGDDQSDTHLFTGSINVTGSLTVTADEDVTTTLGRAKFGSYTTDVMYLSHIDYGSTTDYALAQESSLGNVTINKPTGGTIFFRTNADTTEWQIDTSGNLIGSTGNTLTVASNEDVTTTLGRFRVGSYAADTMYLSHIDYGTTTNYAVRQNANGATVLNAATSRDIQFNLANVNQWTINSSGNLVGSTGNTLTVASNEDVTTTLGRAKIFASATDIAAFAHFDHATVTNYAFKQAAAGNTVFNAATGQSIGFRINDVSRWTINSTGSLVGASGNDLNVTNANISGSHIGDGSGLTGVVASATPAGPNKAVQFNDSGATSGSSTFLYDKAGDVISGSTFSGSFVGDGSGLTGVTAADVEYTNVLNKPTLVSGSAQISYTGITDVSADIVSSSAQFQTITAPFTGSFTGSFAGDGSNLTGVVSTKALTIESPTSTENIAMFFTDVAITISQLNDVVVGTTPSVTWNIQHATTRNAAGTGIFSSDRTTTSETGAETTSFNDATIPAGSWLWFDSSGQSGTVTEINVTIEYSID